MSRTECSLSVVVLCVFFLDWVTGAALIVWHVTEDHFDVFSAPAVG
jgi:hypothetical protein